MLVSLFKFVVCVDLKFVVDVEKKTGEHKDGKIVVPARELVPGHEIVTADVDDIATEGK